MEELKKAYEILGMSEDADLEQIENRYFLLLKKHQSRLKSASGSEQAEEEKKFESVNQAYKMIKTHLRHKSMESNPIYEAEMKKSPLRRKIEHFLHYYKLQLVLGVVAAALIGSYIYTIATKEKELPADLKTMLVGAYYAEELQPLEANMTALVPEWQRVAVLLNFTPNETSSSFDVAHLQRSIAILATERPHIYILDKWQFERLGGETAFLPLDPWEERFRSLVAEDRLIYRQYEGDAEPKLYGINMKGHPVFEGIIRSDADLIFVIRAAEVEREKAVQFIEAMLNTFE